MKSRKNVLKIFQMNFLWILCCVVCGGFTSAEYNCSGGCVGLEASVETSSDSTETTSNNDVSTENLQLYADVFNTSNVEFLRFATPCETPNHEPTFCVSISNCPVLLKVKTKKKYSEFVDASKCGPSNENKKNFKVCCGKYNSFRNVSKQIDTTNNQTISKGSEVLPEKCGTQKQIFRARIVGGIEASLGEYPWMARIIHKNDYNYKTYGCAGFLIHPSYVVTAAHCIESDFTRVRGPPYSVILGEHNAETKIDCSPGGTFCADAPQVSRINSVTVHQNYSKTSKNHFNDIALIGLNKAVKLTEYVQPICLLKDPDEVVLKYYISGWGKTETREASAIKLKVDITPFDKEECKSKFQLVNLEINENQVCAGGVKLKDSCNGDSGGPLMMTPNNSQFYAAGLVSYGLGCGMEGWPGVYTSIPPYVEWIETEIIKNNLSTRSVKIRKTKKEKKNKKKRKDEIPVENKQNVN